MDLSKRGIDYLARQEAEYWKGREEGFLQMLRGVANVMADYEKVPAAERRDRYDEMLLATLAANANFIRIFSIWKPNALDGMDSRYIGRPGSTETGQYAMTYGRDTGTLAVAQNLVVDKIMAHITGPNSRKDYVENPDPMVVQGKSEFIIRMGVPIVNPRTNETVGVVVGVISVTPVQSVVENIIKAHEEIAAMSIYSNNGFIMGCFMPDRVGKMLVDVEIQYGDRRSEVNEHVRAGNDFELFSWAPLLKTNLQISIISIPIGNSDTTWSVMIGSREDYIMKEVNASIRFTVIIAIVAIVIAAIIVFFVLNGTTKPIVKVAETLKDISEGEGDLTRSIAVSSKDEIGDLALYFNKTLEKIKNLIVVI
jgi:methyl-accepting chemotaxis protein